MALPKLLPDDESSTAKLDTPRLFIPGDELLHDPAVETPELFAKPPKYTPPPADEPLEGLLSRHRLSWNSQTGQLEQAPPPPAPLTGQGAPSTTDADAEAHSDPLIDSLLSPTGTPDLQGGDVALLSSKAREVYQDRKLLSQQETIADLREQGVPIPLRSFENHIGTDAKTAERKALAQEPEVQYFSTDASVIPPEYVHKSFKPVDAIRDTLNFVFSDDMALAGIKWDEDGVKFGFDNMKQQLTEHPYISALTVASYAFPIGAAWMKGARVAKRADEIAKLGGQVITPHPMQAIDEAQVMFKPTISKFGFKAEGRGFLGTNLAYRFDDHANLVKNLAYGKYNEGRQLFKESTVEALKLAKTPEDVAKLVSPQELRKILISDHHEMAYLTLRKRAMRNQLTSPREKASWWFQEKFRNTYYDTLTSMTPASAKNLHTFFKEAGLDKWLAAAPIDLKPEHEKAIYKYWLGQGDPATLAKDIGAPAMTFVEGYRTKAKELFQSQFDEGMIEEDTYKLFMDKDKVGSEFHLPALKKMTPDADTLAMTSEYASGLAQGARAPRITTEVQTDVARFLSPPTMKQRVKYTTADEVVQDIDSLITNPESILRGGLIRDTLLTNVHRMFRDSISGFIKKDEAALHQFISQTDLAALPDGAARHWLKFDELNEVVPGLSDRMKRMVNVKMAGEGMKVTDSMMPGGIAKDFVESLWGRHPNSAASSASLFGKFFELISTVHKTSMTALNPATHMNNIVGNYMFLAMAGYNPFSSQATHDARMITRLFIRAAKQHRSTLQAAATGGGREAVGRIERVVFDLPSVSKILDNMGVERIMKDNHGGDIDLAEFFSSPAMRGLIEEQGFDSVEGLQHAEKLIDQIERIGRTEAGHGATAVKAAATAIAGVGHVPGIENVLKNASAAYLGEDMIPKMQYALHLRRKGWGDDAILREVGRRLPQYQTVGSLTKGARKLWFPWMTFSAEASRITKNNLMDNPMSMFTWMHAPDIAQGIVSGAGLGPSFQEYDDALKTVPKWGDKWSTVLVGEQSAQGVVGGAGGALAGAVAGTIATGSPMGALGGAAIGAAGLGAAPAPTAGLVAGAVAGGMMGGGVPGMAIGGALGLGAGLASQWLSQKEVQDQNVARENERVRAYMADFLPLTALTPTTTSDYELAKLNPGDDVPTTGIEGSRTLINLSPVEPFAIVMPMVDIISGKDSFGKDIHARSGFEGVSKTALNFLAFLAPPWMQKYGMKISGPDGNPIDLVEAYAKNGSLLSHPSELELTDQGISHKSITAALGAAAGFGLTALGGAKYAQYAKGAAKAGSLLGNVPWGTAAGAGVAGTLGGYSINARRLFTDLGIMNDPDSQRPGEHTMDFWMNNFFGSAKSFQGSPNNVHRKDNERNRRFDEMRGVYENNIYDSIRNTGDQASTRASLAAVKNSFIAEYSNSETADKKFEDWVLNMIKGMPESSAFRGVTQEELLMRLTAYREANKSKNHHQREIARQVRTELQIREMNKARGLHINAGDLPLPFSSGD